MAEENFVNLINNNDNPYNYIMQCAIDSFNLEKSFYQEIEYKVSSLEDLITKMGQDDSYQLFLNCINKKVFGSTQEPEFVKDLRSPYFYNKIFTSVSKNPVLKFLSQGSQLSKSLNRALKYDQYISGDGIAPVNELAKSIIDNIPEIELKLIDNTENKVQEAIITTIKNFEFFANIKEKRGTSTVWTSKKDKNNETIKIDIKMIVENGYIKISPESNAKIDTEKEKIMVLTDKEVKASFLNQVLENLSESLGSSNGFFESQKNTFKLQYDILFKEQSNNNNIVNILSQTFYNVVYNGLKEPSKSSFDKFWYENNGEISFKKHLNNIDNIENMKSLLFDHKTVAKEKGDIGEVLVQIFIESISNNILSQNLGKIDFGTGQAAVDVTALIKDKKNELIKLGFQVKNFPYFEEEGTTILYEQSNKIFDSKDSLKRYLGTDGLSNLQKLLSSYIDGQINNSDQIQDLVFQAIPSYIRYSESYIKNDPNLIKFSQIKNNFYVINLRFFPASVILYFIAQSVSISNKNNEKNRLLFFSPNKMSSEGYKHSIFYSDRNFDNSLIELAENKSNFINSALNFRGISINFKTPMNKNFVNFK